MCACLAQAESRIKYDPKQMALLFRVGEGSKKGRERETVQFISTTHSRHAREQSHSERIKQVSERVQERRKARMVARWHKCQVSGAMHMCAL